MPFFANKKIIFILGCLTIFFPGAFVFGFPGVMASVAYFLMPWFTHLYVISFLACFIGLAFGGLFTVSAPLVTEVFGLENFGIAFGMVFTAYGFFAGFLGPWLSGMILDISGSNFTIVFSLFAVFYLISALLILKVKKVKT